VQSGRGLSRDWRRRLRVGHREDRVTALEVRVRLPHVVVGRKRDTGARGLRQAADRLAGGQILGKQHRQFGVLGIPEDDERVRSAHASGVVVAGPVGPRLTAVLGYTGFLVDFDCAYRLSWLSVIPISPASHASLLPVSVQAAIPGGGIGLYLGLVKMSARKLTACWVSGELKMNLLPSSQQIAPP
jgi:hypothetical protein